VWYSIFIIFCCFVVVEYFRENRKYNINVGTVFIVVLLCAFSGMRSNQMGVDTDNYIYFFEITPSILDVLSDDVSYIRLEPIYLFIISLFKVFSLNYNLFQLVQTFVLLMILVVSLVRLKAHVNIGLIIYYLVYYYGHFEQQRMAYVYVICLFSCQYIIKRNIKKFFISIIIANGIQYTAIFFLPAYYIYYFFINEERRSYLSINKDDLATIIITRLQRIKFGYHAFIKIGLLLAIAISVTLKYNIFEVLYQFFIGLGITSQENIYALKFISYFENIDEERSLLNAMLGISANFLIISMMFYFRQRWMDVTTIPLFLLYCFGFALMLSTYSFPWLGDRLFKMYAIAAILIVFNRLIITKKDKIVILPILIFLLRRFIMNINAIGSYEFISL
jgi:hypothetical protein